MAKGCDKTQAAGFTLIELLVAFAILSVALGVLFSIFSTGTRRGEETRAERDAADVAQSILAQVGTTIPLIDGDEVGSSPAGVHWRVSITPFSSSDEATGVFQTIPVTVHRVLVAVSWDSDHVHTLTLTTLRLAVRS